MLGGGLCECVVCCSLQTFNDITTDNLKPPPTPPLKQNGCEELSYERLLKVGPEVRIEIILDMRKTTKVLNLSFKIECATF